MFNRVSNGNTPTRSGCSPRSVIASAHDCASSAGPGRPSRPGPTADPTQAATRRLGVPRPHRLRPPAAHTFQQTSSPPHLVCRRHRTRALGLRLARRLPEHETGTGWSGCSAGGVPVLRPSLVADSMTSTASQGCRESGRGDRRWGRAASPGQHRVSGCDRLRGLPALADGEACLGAAVAVHSADSAPTGAQPGNACPGER